MQLRDFFRTNSVGSTVFEEIQSGRFEFLFWVGSSTSRTEYIGLWSAQQIIMPIRKSTYAIS